MVMGSSPQKNFTPAVSQFSAWAFSLGTSVGWGSLVVTSNSYLGQAGPWGSVLGLLIGGLIMLVIAKNYAYLMQIYPEAGGAYAFGREVFGHDFGFLTGWFLALVYLAVLWANATSIPLFARYFMGEIFEYGKLYTIFGYDIYLGEALITILALLLTAALCIRARKASIYAMTGLVCVFAVGITAAFFAAVFGHGLSFDPGFLPDSSAISQVILISAISPWAFIGFENISHLSEEFSFQKTKAFRVLVAAVISTVLLYVFVTLLSVTAYPARYATWLEYIRDRGNLSGLEALPAFYAAQHYLGSAGVWILMASLLALVITSLIGNMTALSRLFYALGKDKILPTKAGELNRYGTPGYAIVLVTAVSLVIPFVGRTAIGWIVDVTTIGATLLYGFVSAAAAKIAEKQKDKTERITGIAGMVLMVLFGLYLLLPTLISTGSLERETYFLFIVWSVLGFLYFRRILHYDKERRFGNSSIVWVALLSLVLFISLIWMRQSMIASNDRMLENVRSYYEQIDDADRQADEQYIEDQIDEMETANTRTIMMAVGMFVFAIMIMLTNHSYMNRRTLESERSANIDPMTGVKSKHAWMKKETEFNNAISAGEAGDFSIVVCDVNGLKKINDTLGHKAGDEYICAACKMVCEIFKHSPVFRIGGDEFVTILTGRDHTARRELMQLLHDRSVAHISEGGVVVSGGISDFRPGEDVNFHSVFQRADELMYEEKQLLKGLGAVTRDEEPEEEDQHEEAPAVLNVRKKVMIVEDEEINRLMLGNILTEDYDLLYAADGLEAMEIVKENQDDLSLMLLDLLMPRKGGMEVLQEMRQDAALKKIPVIVLTADQQAEVECLKLGAADFIPKPYPAFEIIKARVDKCIEMSENRDMIQSTERDALTKLYNVEYFTRYIELYDKHYREASMDAVVIDVNSFHMINERYGKLYGDSVLRRLGKGIRKLAREIGGVCCRQGADTFLLYCPHREDYDALYTELSDGLNENEDTQNRVRLRLGVYAQCDKTLDLPRRFDRAKMAAESVKSGQLKVVGLYNDDMQEQALMKEKLLESFHASIEENRFRVFFQPKYDIRPDKPILASAEALVRWEHPELGMISPGIFIPVLEDSGLIFELDQYVWNETAAQIRKWKDAYGFTVPVSVNVSRIDMLMPDLKSVFNAILAAHDLTAEDIVLEITESAYTDDSDQVISTARELRGMDMGFRIEMDDFGTGYSSLGMLSKLPIDALKLDMTFVRNAFGGNRDVRMIELIIDIADYLNVPVIAEGVETEEQLLALKALGCDLVQGYYFSKPVPEDEFVRFLLERKEQSVQVMPAARKSYESISKALTADYESIYYIDTVTDYYLEFYAGSDGQLQIRPGGDDFFTDAEAKILADVVPEDQRAVKAALAKENVIRWSGRDEPVMMKYRRKGDPEAVLYRLQTFRTRNRDDHHVMIGIRPE